MIEKRFAQLILRYRSTLLFIVTLQNVDYEVRAGLSSVYADKGWVAADLHAESASRTFDYACESNAY
jgi:hypothetical protein